MFLEGNEKDMKLVKVLLAVINSDKSLKNVSGAFRHSLFFFLTFQYQHNSIEKCSADQNPFINN